MGQPPVLTSSNRFSTLQQRFACARLSQSYLSESCPDVSATFTTIAFDDSSLRWMEPRTCLPASKGPSSSLIQLRPVLQTALVKQDPYAPSAKPLLDRLGGNS